MRIRKAESDDVSAIERVVEAAYPRLRAANRKAAGADGGRRSARVSDAVWIGHLADVVVGILAMRPSKDVLERENVAVDPAYQDRGHSRTLVDFAERHAGELGLSAVELYANEAMSENLRLYPRLGYAETGRGVEDGYRRVYLRKALDARSVRELASARG